MSKPFLLNFSLLDKDLVWTILVLSLVLTFLVLSLSLTILVFNSGLNNSCFKSSLKMFFVYFQFTRKRSTNFDEGQFDRRRKSQTRRSCTRNFRTKDRQTWYVEIRTFFLKFFIWNFLKNVCLCEVCKVTMRLDSNTDSVTSNNTYLNIVKIFKEIFKK